MTGSTIVIGRMALNKFAERETRSGTLVAISGSNDTTGRICARYSSGSLLWRTSSDASLAGPFLLKTFRTGHQKLSVMLTKLKKKELHLRH